MHFIYLFFDDSVQKFLGFLIFLITFIIGFWCLFYILFIIPYWIMAFIHQKKNHEKSTNLINSDNQNNSKKLYKKKCNKLIYKKNISK